MQPNERNRRLRIKNRRLLKVNGAYIMGLAPDASLKLPDASLKLHL